MRNLYVHCGLAKTGTTSLQDFLFHRRAELRTQGCDYTGIGIRRGRSAHHNLAFEMLANPNFYPQCGTAADFLTRCGKRGRTKNILISSEFFAAALTTNGAQKRFLDFIRNAQKCNDSVFAIFTFRSFWKRAESAFFEEMKNGRHLRSVSWHIAMSNHWLVNFFKNLDALRDVIGEDHIVALDVETGARDSITSVLSSVGLREDCLPPRDGGGNLNTRFSLKKVAYLYGLQYNPGGTPKKHVAGDIGSVVRAIAPLPLLAGDSSDYRIFTVDQANAIQGAAHSCMPAFLAEPLRNLVRPETATFDATDLSEVRLTKEDYAIFNEARANKSKRALSANAHCA